LKCAGFANAQPAIDECETAHPDGSEEVTVPETDFFLVVAKEHRLVRQRVPSTFG
jgi:hypothetical protein